MSETDMKVGLIGLGTMGGAIARRLLYKGIDLRIYDTDHNASREISKQYEGVYVASSVSDLAAGVDVTICSLPHPDALLSVVSDPGGLAEKQTPGSLVVDVSTSGPTAVRECESVLRKHDIEMVDAPVGKGPAAAMKGDLTLMLAGQRPACDRAEKILTHIASQVFYCGPAGSGQVLKLANNLVACANLAAIAEAYQFVSHQGADVNTLLEIMSGTYADSFQLQKSVRDKAMNGDFDIVFRLDLAAKDVLLARDENTMDGSSPVISEATLNWYKAAVDSGYGKIDWSAVILMADGTLVRANSD